LRDVPVPVHGGSRKTDPSRKLVHRRKWKRIFGKSREYCLIARTAFHIWNFGRGGFLSAGKMRAASIFGHRRVCHSVLPKRAYKIVVDGSVGRSIPWPVNDAGIQIYINSKSPTAVPPREQPRERFGHCVSPLHLRCLLAKLDPF
jgi:hypothetical protein